MSAEKIAADLELKVTLKSPRHIEPGTPIELEMTLHNRSRTSSHWVVKPGDGSEVGWREPHVFFTAQRERAPGSWEDVPPFDQGRCGMFDFDWGKDAQRLPPGGKLPLGGWLSRPDQRLDLQEPGRVRLYVHYKYSAGAGQRSGMPPKGELATVPAYEVVSAPVELQLERPLELTFNAKQPLKLGKATPLSSVFEVSLSNRSSKPLDVAGHAAGARLAFELAPSSRAPVPHLDNHQSTGEHPQPLAAGATLPLIGAAASPPVDNKWQLSESGTVKLRAVYYLYRRGEIIRTLKSRWVDVRVEA